MDSTGVRRLRDQRDVARTALVDEVMKHKNTMALLDERNAARNAAVEAGRQTMADLLEQQVRNAELLRRVAFIENRLDMTQRALVRALLGPDAANMMVTFDPPVLTGARIQTALKDAVVNAERRYPK